MTHTPVAPGQKGLSLVNHMTNKIAIYRPLQGNYNRCTIYRSRLLCLERMEGGKTILRGEFSVNYISALSQGFTAIKDEYGISLGHVK